jgi:transposase-like protein
VYSPELRARVLTHLARRREEGATVVEVAEELGVGIDSLYRWRRVRSAFVPIAVVPAATERTFTVRGPGGLVIEGLTLDVLAELLRRLA